MAYKPKLALLPVIAFVLACLMSHSIWSDEEPLRILAIHYPPYEFNPPSHGLKGFDVEVVETIFQRMGSPVKVDFLPWVRSVEITYAGKAMALLTCSREKSRDAHILYSDAISAGTFGYFLRKNFQDPNFESIEALRGQKIAVVRGYTTQFVLESYNIDHTQVRTDEIALNILVGKRVDFYYSGKESNVYIANQLGLSDKIKFHPLKSKSFHLCFSKKWPKSKELLTRFNDGLAQLKADGSYKQIHDKYR